jgi:hypothetical protein
LGAPNHQTLRFPDAPITFQTNGAATESGGLYSDLPLPTSVANIDATLTWSISFDGTTFSQFATTTQKIFVTLAPPQGFAGTATGVPAAPTITAARLNRVTRDAAGGVDPVSAATLVQANFASFKIPLAGISYVDLVSSGPNNAWLVFDQVRQASAGLDCLSQTTAVTVELLMAGVNATIHYAFPTVYAGQAGIMLQDNVNPADGSIVPGGTLSDLDFLLGGGNFSFAQAFEAYFALCSSGTNGTASYAETVAPWSRTPFTGSGETCTASLPQMGFTIIKSVLLGIQAQPDNGPNGGRQWWMSFNSGLPVYGPVPFPSGYGVK